MVSLAVNGAEVTATSASASLAVAGAADIYAVAEGQDPEGLQDIQIWVSESYDIDNGDGTATRVDAGLVGRPRFSNPDGAAAGTTPGTSCSRRVLATPLHVPDVSPRRLLSYQADVWAAARNFGRQVVRSSRIRLTWTP
jgi:hypothetical protein